MSLSAETPSLPNGLKPNPIFARLKDAYDTFHERRRALGLSNPGTIEKINKEVQQDVFLTNSSFTGLRADITKVFSASPMFQVSHSLAMGSQMLPPYTIAALYGSPKVFMQANLDSDYSLSSRFNWRWSPAFVTKTNVSLASNQAICSIENDYIGADFSASLRMMNPSILEGGLTGMFIGSYLQSITPRLSLGLEGLWQRRAFSEGPELLVSYAARYKGSDWIASAQLLAQGGVTASYWRRLTERVETGVDCTLQFAGLGMPKGMMQQSKAEGVATLGARYDFRASSVRVQVDSHGKTAVLLEKRVAPVVSVTFAGEIDHPKNQAKLGLAMSLESADEAVMEQSEKAGDVSSPPF